jgi:hypothetical protein
VSAEPGGERRTYEEKHQLMLDLVMLLFGGLMKVILKRRGTVQ